MKPLRILNKHLLYLLIFVFLFVSASAISFSDQKTTAQPSVKELVKKRYEIKPFLSENARFPIFSATSIYAIDLDSKTSLFEKNPNTPSLPASTAKIMTALVSLDFYPLDAALLVGKVNVEGQKMGLKQGEKIAVDGLLKGLLIFSANDAAEVLASNFPGGRDLFIAKMNLKAKELGLEKSHFINPAGLDGAGQYTTAKDLVKASDYAMQIPYIAKIVAKEEENVRSTDGNSIHRLKNINRLIGKVDGVLGVKTGWTENARENLVTYVERDGHRVMIALLGSQDRFGETEELIDWIFKNHSWQLIEILE